MRVLFFPARRLEKGRLLHNDDILIGEERHRLDEANELIDVHVAGHPLDGVLASPIREKATLHGIYCLIHIIMLLARQKADVRNLLAQRSHKLIEFHSHPPRGIGQFSYQSHTCSRKCECLPFSYYFSRMLL